MDLMVKKTHLAGVETRSGVLADFEASSDCIACPPGVVGFTKISLLTEFLT